MGGSNHIYQLNVGIECGTLAYGERVGYAILWYARCGLLIGCILFNRGNFAKRVVFLFLLLFFWFISFRLYFKSKDSKI